MFWLEKNLILSNVLITGESNFDEKNVKEVFNMCSTEQSCISIGITCYKIGTLGGTFSHYQHECVFLQIAKVMSSNPWIGLGMLRFECSFATFSFRVAH